MTLKRPEEFDHFTAHLPDLDVHYVRQGAGPSLMLWHGWPGFWWDWRFVIDDLSQDFDVIVPDFRGSGDSSKFPLSDLSQYKHTQLARDQAALLDSLGIDKTYIFGHDNGATVCHKFLRLFPERVIKAGILDPITPGYGSMEGNYSDEDWFIIFEEFDSALELVSLNRDSRRIYYKHFFDEWSYRKPLLSDEELEVLVDNYMKPGNVEGGFGYDRANLSRSAAPWEPEDFDVYEAPITLLWAENDPAVPPSGAAHLDRFYTDYTLTMIPECGHFAMLEKPQVVIDAIRTSFLTP